MGYLNDSDPSVPSKRSRHGRGIRRPLWSSRFAPGSALKRSFDEVVQDTADYLRDNYPNDFAELNVVVRDLPPMASDPTLDLGNLRRYGFHRASQTIYVYRIPIKYLGRSLDPLIEFYRVESYVIEAAAEMINRDPRDFFTEL